jgi:hypothetical protein
MARCRTAAVAGAGAVLALATPVAAPAASSVHLRGTAYEFNHVGVRLGGAQVRVAEDPTLGATARPDGTYDLRVPDGRRITPYINAAGHHTIYLQTFRTRGQDLDNVNFQTPSDGVYRALAALLDVPVGADGDLAQCAIVSTFSTRRVRDLPFGAFTAYGAHGVAGATAFASPALPAPIYFNKDVLPDRAQAASSEDGGVIWPVVPAGTYEIRAHHPSTRFAPFTATCAPGRVVNANPPWGLHELGRSNPARVTSSWVGPRPRTLRLSRLPAGAKVTATCAGRGCPFTTRTLVAAAVRPALDVRARLGAGALRRLRGGQRLTLLVGAHGYDGVAIAWRLRASGAQRMTTRVVPLGGPAA